MTAQTTKLNYFIDYIRKHSCVDCNESDPLILEFDHVRGLKRHDVTSLLYRAFSLKSLVKEIDKCEVRCANCHRIKTAIERGTLKAQLLQITLPKLTVKPYIDSKDVILTLRTKKCSKCNKVKDLAYFLFRFKGDELRQSECKECSYNRQRRAKSIKIAIKACLVLDYLSRTPCSDCSNSNLMVLEFDHVKDEKVNHISKMMTNHTSASILMKEIKKCEIVCANCHKKRTSKRANTLRLKLLSSRGE